jgi:hypothetical protein
MMKFESRMKRQIRNSTSPAEAASVLRRAGPKPAVSGGFEFVFSAFIRHSYFVLRHFAGRIVEAAWPRVKEASPPVVVHF